MAPTHIGFRADDDLSVALAAEAARQGTTVSDVARDGLRATYCTPRPSYGAGSQFSLVADAWDVTCRGTAAEDAVTRITAFRAGLAAGTAFAHFGMATTGNASPLIAPGYSGLVADQGIDRPLWGLTTQQTISAPTPFAAPAVATTTGATSPHVEGVNPTPGTVTFAGAIVTPVGRSGIYDVTRELLDSASPAADAIVLTAMAEDFNAKLEQLVAAELAAVAPSGATAAGTLARDVKREISAMVRSRRRRAAAAVVSAADTLADAAADGFAEDSGDQTAQWHAQGARIDLSADLGDSSGEVVAAVTAPASLWSWSAEPRRFEFEQMYGPALIRLSLFGYAAVKTIRPSGVRTLTLS